MVEPSTPIKRKKLFEPIVEQLEAQMTSGALAPGDALPSERELMERFGEVALDLLGMEGTLGEGSPGAVLRGRIEQNLRHALMWVISIGTNEIQRSLIAQRGLGLPR